MYIIYIYIYTELIFLLRKMCRHLGRSFFHERLMAVSMYSADPTATPATCSPRGLNVIAVLAALSSNPPNNLKSILYQLESSGQYGFLAFTYCACAVRNHHQNFPLSRRLNSVFRHTLTLNIPSLARQRCLPSWGSSEEPHGFCVISQLFDAVDYSNYVFWRF